MYCVATFPFFFFFFWLPYFIALGIMKRRPVRAGNQPSFSLQLPTGVHSEVQVQNKNTDELTTFIIDGDIALESPTITTCTRPPTDGRLGTFSTVGPGTTGGAIGPNSSSHLTTSYGMDSFASIKPSVSSSVAVLHSSSEVFPSLTPRSSFALSSTSTGKVGNTSTQGASSAVAASTTGARSLHPHHASIVTSATSLAHSVSAGGPLFRPSSSPLNVSGSPDGHHPVNLAPISSSTAHSATPAPAPAPQFFHVRDTNLFVLLDGVSMFYDGKSTYTGMMDSDLLHKLGERERLRKKRNPSAFASGTSVQHHTPPPGHHASAGVTSNTRGTSDTAVCSSPVSVTLRSTTTDATPKGKCASPCTPTVLQEEDAAAMHDDAMDTVEMAIRDVESALSAARSAPYSKHDRGRKKPSTSCGVPPQRMEEELPLSLFLETPPCCGVEKQNPERSSSSDPSASMRSTKDRDASSASLVLQLSAPSTLQGGVLSSPAAVMATIQKKSSAYLQLFAHAEKPPRERIASYREGGTTALPKPSGLLPHPTPLSVFSSTDSPRKESNPAKTSCRNDAASIDSTPPPLSATMSLPSASFLSSPFPVGGCRPPHRSYASSASSISCVVEKPSVVYHQGGSLTFPTVAPIAGEDKIGVGDVAVNSVHSSPSSSCPSNWHSSSSTRKKKDARVAAKSIAIDAIGRKNDSVELDEVTFCHVMGVGTQGTVSMVELNKKFYAMKMIDVDAIVATLNASERHVRKRGLIGELEMTIQQRRLSDPKNLIRMFNAVCNTDEQGRRRLYLLMELMWADLARIGELMERLSFQETYKITQSTFREYLRGDNRTQEELERLQKDVKGSCKHVCGRMRYAEPEQWEKKEEGRKTPFPEIILSMLAADLLQGLKELHEDYHLVHCDLKPMNILLSYDREHFKLADFGCSHPIDPVTKRTTPNGMDVGTKLYKSPERFQNTLMVFEPNTVKRSNAVGERTVSSSGNENVDHDREAETNRHDGLCVDYSGKADVWSLGILLLELSAGIHPCTTFKTEYWNYCAHLKLSKMIKPLQWSAGLFDFILRCTFVEESERWSVPQLMKHPFVARYRNVPRRRLATFMHRLEEESATIHRRKQREWLEQQIRLSALGDQINFKRKSYNAWREFTSFLPREAPAMADRTVYPELRR